VAAVFNNLTASSIVSWNDTQVVATVAVGTYGVRRPLCRMGCQSNGIAFTMTPPTLTSISPTVVSPGMQVTFTGSGFGATRGDGAAVFNNLTASSIVQFGTTLQVVATVAVGTYGGSGVHCAEWGAKQRHRVYYDAADVDQHLADGGIAGDASGPFTGKRGFGATRGDGAAVFNNLTASSIVSWNDTQVVATVAVGTYGGESHWRNTLSAILF